MTWFFSSTHQHQSNNSQLNPTSQEQQSSSSRNHVRQKDKIMAACAGGVLTSLTMTPLDVIKTRLQTQLPNSSSSSNFASSHPSTPQCINSSLLSTRRSTTAYLQTSQNCCKQAQTHLNSLSNETILRRFDPRALKHSCASLSLSLNGSSSTNLSGLFKSSASSSSWIQSTSSSNPLIQSFRLPPHPSTVPASGIIDSIFKIVQHEGVGTLWRGIGPTLVMAIPAQAVYMVGYDTLRSNLLELGPRYSLEDRLGPPNGWYRTTIAPLLAGVLSRSLVAVLFCPLELLRTRLQSAPPRISPLTQFNRNQSLSELKLKPSKSILKSTLSSVQHSGITSLYRGLSATLWRDVPFSGIYWSTYEMCRKMISDGNGFGESIPGSESFSVSRIASESFLAGSISGCFAAILTNPFDLIKTRRQVMVMSSFKNLELENPSKHGTLRMIYQIARLEGRKGLMKGLSPRLAKIIPSCGIMIVSLEWNSKLVDD
ncbi:uncharacterized protein MELLADRAFT_60557 [Melampsora larici-populina 98AG31]|uniref:Mitochondrial carrier protein n=1 Tax=Melampsora larici-populina (strain 98AG31 / pathotype 3-4-7) TaxID=747676 RepID=F4RB32_MELLP|nr:uncharacterized protein MELLADRAFT_60557 [Melampsora larici-populina 98AG31]EGG10332.1 hypothetical protein MELLADRAFT_60557 [Melampsora larici-populina 98AG31]